MPDQKIFAFGFRTTVRIGPLGFWQAELDVTLRVLSDGKAGPRQPFFFVYVSDCDTYKDASEWILEAQRCIDRGVAPPKIPIDDSCPLHPNDGPAANGAV